MWRTRGAGSRPAAGWGLPAASYRPPDPTACRAAEVRFAKEDRVRRFNFQKAAQDSREEWQVVDGEVVAAPAMIEEEGDGAGAGADAALAPKPQARPVTRQPLGLGEFLAVAKLGESAALIEQQDLSLIHI